MKRCNRYYLILLFLTVFLCACAATAQHGMMPGMYDYGMSRSDDYRQGRMACRQETPIDRKQAEKILTEYIDSTGNSNLKSGKIVDKEDVFEAEIVTQDNSLVDRIWIEKNTGCLKTRYGMWDPSMGQGRGMDYEGGRTMNYCPYCGEDVNPDRYRHMGMGPGMMHRYGMGRGMHHGMGYRGGILHHQWDVPENKEDAQKIIETYLERMRNPNLKVGKIKETDTAFEAEILTRKQEDLVNKYKLDKQTGRIWSDY